LDQQNNLSNNLVQIKTGEGKSIILGVIATVLALFGFEVSCACYSSELTKRDYKEFEYMFTAFGVKD
jgi:hypothetical protein